MSRYGSSIFNDRRRAKHIRTQFMETFLWLNFTMNGKDTKQTIEVPAPDSTTTYFVSGFALSPTMGLGLIKQPLKFIVKSKFYLDVSLPYSVKRGEVLVVRAIVFNFLQHKLTTQVTLYSKRDQLELVEKSSNDRMYLGVFVLIVNSASFFSASFISKAKIAQPNTGTTVSFVVKAKQIGLIAIKLQAECQLGGDLIEHMLRVTPESHQYHLYQNQYIQLPTHNRVTYNFSLNVPKKIDAGSLKIHFSVDRMYSRKEPCLEYTTHALGGVMLEICFVFFFQFLTTCNELNCFLTAAT